MENFNISLGKQQETTIAQNDIKAGVRRDDLKDEKLKSIFDRLDNGNGIIEEGELEDIKSAISNAAKADGDETNLSKKEAKQLIKNLGLSGIKAQDLFDFLAQIKSASANVDYLTKNVEHPDEIVIARPKDKDGNQIFEIYNEDGTLNRTETSGKASSMVEHADGRLEGKDDVGNYTRKVNPDGTYIDTYEDGRVRYYDKDGRLTGGKNSEGMSFVNKYNEDGSYIQEWSDGNVQYYDKDGRRTGGKLPNGTIAEVIYDEKGNRKYDEFKRKNGSVYYWGPNGGYAEKTANGNFKAHAKHGESFNDTMLRLGITAPKDQQIFIKANPKAYKRGYFLISKPNANYGDVYIPKEIADKLDISNILVNSGEEYEKSQQAKQKTTSFGI